MDDTLSDNELAIVMTDRQASAIQFAFRALGDLSSVRPDVRTDLVDGVSRIAMAREYRPLVQDEAYVDTERPTELLPLGGTQGQLVQVNGWLYEITADGEMQALDSRDARYIPMPEETDDHPITFGLKWNDSDDGLTVKATPYCTTCDRWLIRVPGVRGGVVHQGTD